MTGWFEKLLTKILPYRDITKVVDGVELLYLRRFFLRRGKKGSTTGDEGGIFLHVIHRQDDDRDPHDHPWSFTSLILKGGYWDEQWLWVDDDRSWPDYRVHTGNEWVGRGRIVKRSAEHLHRVQGITPGRPAWTLVFTGPRRREWGFTTEHGWVHWREYLGLDA
jgi:hypothetical protein